jgi:putative membrane protein
VKLASAVAAIIGLAIIGVLVVYFGAGAVVHSLLAVGWVGFATVCLIHVVLIGVMGVAWWVLLPGTSLWVSIWGRLVRDAGSEVLPLSQIGGYLLGARAIMFAGVSGTAAAASTIVDVTLEFLAQIAFTALALVWLIRLTPDAWIEVPVAIGLVAAILLAGGLFFAQRYGFDLFDRLAGTIGRDWADKTATGAAALHTAIAGIYQRRARLGTSLGLHLFSWIAATAEAWLALQFAGAPLGFGAVLVIEGLVYAMRSVAFAVPNAVGVQEGAYIIFGESLGLNPEMALALSLLKRARDLVIGLPAFAAWQLLESGRLWRRVPAPE